MNAKAKSNMGKPMPPKLKAGSETKRVQVMVPEAWLGLVDEWRRRQPKIPSRSEAIRIMVENYAKESK
jgi:metal-responsive CopG/Arc/MetJ family transcriptional regulator